MRNREVIVKDTPDGLIGVFLRRMADGSVNETLTPPIPVDTETATWLRAPSSSGGKDWICCTTPRGIVTVWGRIWQAKQKSAPKRVDPHALVAGKEMKGYEHVAHFRVRSWQFIEPVLADEQGDSASAPPARITPLDWAIIDWMDSERKDWF